MLDPAKGKEPHVLMKASTAITEFFKRLNAYWFNRFGRSGRCDRASSANG